MVSVMREFCDILHASETAEHDKRFSAQSVRVILLPAETRHESQSRGQSRHSRNEARSRGLSRQEAIRFTDSKLGRKRDYGQSRQKPNMTDSLGSERKSAD